MYTMNLCADSEWAPRQIMTQLHWFRGDSSSRCGVGVHLLEGEVEGPEEAGQLAHAGGQGLHLCLGQAPPPHLAPKGQPRQEAKVLLKHSQVYLTTCLYGNVTKFT